MGTTLKNENKRIEKDENEKVFSSDVINRVNFRISRHLSFIEKDYEVIKDNSRFSNIVEEALSRIKDRENKIEELKEFLEYCL